VSIRNSGVALLGWSRRGARTVRDVAAGLRLGRLGISDIVIVTAQSTSDPSTLNATARLRGAGLVQGVRARYRGDGELPRKPVAPRQAVDLHALGARAVSVFGAFNSRVLIEMPAEAAQELFPEPFSESGRLNVIEAAEREVEAIGERDASLAGSALAASAVALAYEIANPFNSATSKSMCAREMRDTLDRLRELAPEEDHADSLDELKQRRTERQAKAS
jgi:hypothetical protein